METASYIFSEKANSSFSNISPFYIKKNITELAILFRIFSGSCVITNKNTDEAVELRYNYFYEGNENNEGDLTFFDNFEEGLTLSHYEDHIRAKGFRNRRFYKSLLNETSAAIYNIEKERHTAAFVHLYRTYEHLSYAFPMMYAAKTEDYIGTFENLKKWMTNSSSDGNVGELKFHDRFLKTVFDSSDLENTIDISITTREEFKESIFDGLSKKVLGWDTAEKYTDTTERPNKLSIKFIDFHTFFINLRNKFFHYSNAGHNNIGLDDIIESELLFSFVNKPILNYIATIFHAVIKHQM